MECTACSARVLRTFVRALLGCDAAASARQSSSRYMRRPDARFFGTQSSLRFRQSAVRQQQDASSVSGIAESGSSAVSRSAQEKDMVQEAVDTTGSQVQPTASTVNPEKSQPKKPRTSASRQEKPVGPRVKLSGPRIITKPAPAPLPKPKKERWQIEKAALERKLDSQAWNPRKRLSPDTLDGIRNLHMTDPARFTTPVLAEQFKVSPDAIRRILKSKWRPNEDEHEDRMKRWNKRGERIWTNMVELGTKPPKKWREMGVGRAAPGRRRSGSLGGSRAR
ncbi:Required for respiratory growth protein 9 mitochondrial [Coniosporium tulheliwenetii]|uniref:Required for respiratory growth protein 9 mitochondrial n=1 Tax=Coniosporium tulheliwenetii TaxID=3383036 RepID=A0ACC2ZPE1_9PEZI|nr:Required for respiratory growth protein 9 mitochondrial [Cladosporium sp. JES 115]